ncbi:hypothetical protein PybrP1_007478 [[Pythium] brassicae (nom. inval.)]|nr:hypothetical protein PybrP1_007478 [[Pythium] brassicae (nom. inval.)]
MSPRRLFLLLTAALSLLLLSAPPATVAFECSACQYTAHNCSSLAATTTAADDPGVPVCNAAGQIQIDDVFCDDDECRCADDRRCASLVVGCSNVFQARSRKRCLGRDAEQTRFRKCAVAQALTSAFMLVVSCIAHGMRQHPSTDDRVARNETNLDPDWVFFKDSARCRSRDCDAVRQFHHSGVVQCGYLIVAWKDSDALFHFVVDGSRARDMAAGVFHFQAPLDSGVLAVARVSESRVQACFSLQTRNQGDSSAACDGYYIKYDTALQLNSGDDYKLSKLDWPVWLLVVGSVAAAAAAVVGVAVFTYRLRHADAGEGVNDELLGSVDDDASAAKKAREAALPTANHSVLRQRALSPRSSAGDAAPSSADAV